MNSANEQIKWSRDDAEAISHGVDYKYFDECAALYWPNAELCRRETDGGLNAGKGNDGKL